MACVLTQGFSEECDDILGGVKAGQFLIGQLSDVTASTVVDGEVTVLTAGTFYRYWQKKETATAIATRTKEGNGSAVTETIVTTYLQRITKEKNTELKLVMGKPNVLIYQDNEGTWHCAGLDTGADLLNAVSSIEAGFNGKNGYDLSFTAREKNFPYTVDATVVAGLTIA